MRLLLVLKTIQQQQQQQQLGWMRLQAVDSTSAASETAEATPVSSELRKRLRRAADGGSGDVTPADSCSSRGSRRGCPAVPARCIGVSDPSPWRPLTSNFPACARCSSALSRVLHLLAGGEEERLL
jgi:hypothetical protein